MPALTKAPDDVAELVTEIQQAWHPKLNSARIDVLFRKEAKRSKGRVTLGEARKVTDQWRLYCPYDFILTFAEDEWELLTDEQRRAVVDHELTHCRLFDGEWVIVDHDVMEFAEILGRHGFYLEDYQRLRKFIQPHFAFVDSIEPDPAEEQPVNQEDVLDQIGDMLVARSKRMNGNGNGAGNHEAALATKGDDEE